MSKLFDFDEIINLYEVMFIEHGEIEVHVDIDIITIRPLVGRSHIEFVGVVLFKDMAGDIIYTCKSGGYKASTGSRYAADRLERQLKDYGLIETRTNVFAEEFEEIITVQRAMRKLGFDSIEQFNSNLKVGPDFKFVIHDVVNWYETKNVIQLIHDDAIVHEFDKND